MTWKEYIWSAVDTSERIKRAEEFYKWWEQKEKEEAKRNKNQLKFNF